MPVIRRRRPVRVVRRRRINMVRRPIGRTIVTKKLMGSKVHYFKRTAFYSGMIAGSTLLDVGGALVFQLNSLPNYTEFTNLFDMYRINGVKVTFMPRGNSAEVGTNQGIVKLFSAIDYDDNTTPASLSEILQYETLKTTNSTRDHKRYIKPKLARVLYQAGASNAYGAGTGWIDCSNPQVPHYGMKYVLQQLPAGAQSYDCKITFYLAFKNVV